MRTIAKRLVVIAVLIAFGGLVLIQLVPYGRDHANPPVQSEPNWDSQQTRELTRRACFDCHSNETTWPWYSNIAPMSWLVQHNADEGRRILNFSTWKQGGAGREAGESLEAVAEGFMPPADYLLAHPNARLSQDEKKALLDGLRATIYQ